MGGLIYYPPSRSYWRAWLGPYDRIGTFANGDARGKFQGNFAEGQSGPGGHIGSFGDR